MNLQIARDNMLAQQLRTCDVLDERVLNLLQDTPRDAFVPARYRALAYADFRVPLAHEQCMMTPLEEGCLLQAVQIQQDDLVLEIGTGSAYLTALCAKLARRVVSLDYYGDFIEDAKARIGAQNVTLVEADGEQGWASQAPYDVIILTASLAHLRPWFKQQLRLGGRLFVILGTAPVMDAVLMTYLQQGDWQVDKLFTTAVAPLIGADSRRTFIF